MPEKLESYGSCVSCILKQEVITFDQHNLSFKRSWHCPATSVEVNPDEKSCWFNPLREALLCAALEIPPSLLRTIRTKLEHGRIIQQTCRKCGGDMPFSYYEERWVCKRCGAKIPFEMEVTE